MGCNCKTDALIKHVQGNVLRLAIPLTVKIRDLVDGQPTEREEHFYPDASRGVKIVLDASYITRAFDGAVSGNVVSMEDVGTLKLGNYQVTVLCYDNSGIPYRYMARNIIAVVDATADAGIEAGIEFDSETYTLEGAYFIKGEKGDTGEGVPSGGTTGQVLKKKSNNDYDTEWSSDNAPVTSVNGKTGEVTLGAEEVGALPADTPIPTVPTDVSSFNNDAGYITKSVNDLVNYYLKSETYTKQEVQGLIAAIQQFHYEIYASTSDVTSPQGNVLYLIGPTGTGDDKYEEYVYANSQFVKIGDTTIDLSGYYTSQQTDTAITQALNTALADYTTTAALTLLLEGKQDALVSGTNIKTLNGESILGSGNMDIIGCYTPALSNAPTSSTTAYIKDGKTIKFEIGQFCRVPNINGTYTFYQLYDLVIDGNTTSAVWQEVLVDEDFSLAITVLGANDIPQFDPDEPYSVGAFVMNNGFLYKFTSPHTSGEPWNPQEVQQTNLVTEVNDMVKSDYEGVIIDLKTETNDPLPNVEVVVTVEGEQSGRNLTTDAQGRCTTNVQKGLEYTVSCANVPNYLPVTDIVRRASLPMRYITVTYAEDDTLTRETVKITVGYSDQTLPKATWVRISYGGENYQLALNDENIAETTIRLGTVYTVSFEDIDGYKTPSPQTYTASLHGTRNINVSYVAPVAGLKWLMTNNTERELNDVSDLERINGDIFGLIVQTSDLMAAGCSFVIPLPFLLTQSATGTGQWLSANVTVPQLKYFGSLQAALADLDGDANCAGIEQFIAEAAQQGTTYTSSMVSNCRGRVGGAPSFDDTKNYEAGDYVVYRNYLHLFLVDHAAGPWVDGETEQMTGFLMPDGVVRKCFSPAFAQIYAFRLLRDKVNEFTTSVFGIGSCNIANGAWWCSTQFNAVGGVLLSNGAFYGSNGKTGYFNLLPVLAY